MNEKIIIQMLDTLRGPLTKSEWLEFTLQVLAWVKLSVNQELPEQLLLNAELLNTHPANVVNTFNQLGEYNENTLIHQAFSNSKHLNRLDPVSLLPAFKLALNLSNTGVLKNLDAAKAIGLVLLENKFSGEFVLPFELSVLLIQLSGIGSGDSAYIPWDFSGQLAAQAVKNNTDVYLETPLHSAIPALISLLTDKPFKVCYTDPIANPLAIKDGKLRQFDVVIAFPPMGLRYSLDVIKRDLFGRFPESTPMISVLSIRHLLSQANRRVVVAIPSGLLFSGGAELSLRQDLLRRGCIEAVIAMPAGLFSTTNIAFSILILDSVGGREYIKFVNATESLRFLKSISKARLQLVDVETFAEEILSPDESENSAIVSVNEVLANDAQLQVSRYVLSDDKKQLQAKLESAHKVTLSEVVTTIRPMPTTSNDDDIIEAWEIGAVNLPPFGYISSSGRSVKVESQIALKNEQQFLRPYDIVLIIKGSVGKIGIVPKDVPSSGAGGWIAGQSAIVLRTVKDAQIEASVLALQLRSPLGQELIKGIISGATIPLIQLKELMKLPVLLPDLETAQCAIEALEKEADLQQKIDCLQQEQAQVAADFWSL